jgi:hypothetical protein
VDLEQPLEEATKLEEATQLEETNPEDSDIHNNLVLYGQNAQNGQKYFLDCFHDYYSLGHVVF